MLSIAVRNIGEEEPVWPFGCGATAVVQLRPVGEPGAREAAVVEPAVAGRQAPEEESEPSCGNLKINLLRTYAALMEALQRY
jgi:hypothetical protein